MLEVDDPAVRSAGILRVWMVVAAFVVVGAAVPIALHIARYGVNVGQIVLVTFTWINVMIALWEISLNLRISLVERQHRRFVADYRGRELDRVIDFFTAPIRIREIVRPSTWAQVWSSYSLFDPAYANRKSFGFWVDSGNGYVTLIPSLLFIYALTFDIVPARALGIIGLVIFWMMFYGTVLYYVVYFVNKEYVGHTARNLAIFIGGTNSLWLFAPAWGMVASIILINTDSYGFLR
ncbi:Uncharacterised protein [Nocardia otitidiscaviarum]|uniref:Uncharacterized protein n=1 Tax=Nocardia otitidiscaviarum TaxID=1823 RepID=A0A378Y782_9NOCA|nr:hypothetical protein [Nocardia otitidiscaviarum]MBF6238491.1 hypothetical protein [Nocardia otitidiscaviarum]SUA73072.1 Uncharacterised protein [Nocardia otitidiscaviarum]